MTNGIPKDPSDKKIAEPKSSDKETPKSEKNEIHTNTSGIRDSGHQSSESINSD